MGQQQSTLAAKGAHHTGFSSRLADSPADGPLRQDASLQEHQSSNQHTPPVSAADVTVSTSSSSQLYTMEVQSKSVRAAIDSFIENCLATSSDNGTPPPQISLTEARSESSDVEICETAPDIREEPKDTSDIDKSDHSISTSNSGVSECQENAPSQKGVHDVTQNDTTANPQPDVEKSGDGGKAKGEGSVSVKSEDCSAGCQSEQSADKLDASANQKLPEDAAPRGSILGASERVDDNTNGNQRGDNSHSKDASDDSSDGDGATSVRFKTIIDRVLDNSLGTSPDIRSIPHEQRILTQLAADEKASAAKPATVPVSNANTGRKETVCGNTSEKKIEPMAVCFMDHIEKAVERSFSSITEEEERKEKEKALAAREIVREPSAKNPSWGGRLSKTATETSGSSGGDGTISVQDIVDRVISQTEVISKLMTTSTGHTSQTDTKPTATAAGTFYPSRAPADFISHPSRREGSSKEYSSTSKEGERRRGRPRIQSPYPDAREVANQEYPSGGSSRDMSGSRGGSGAGVTGEEYLHPMAAMARFSTTHPPGQGMHPFVSSALAANAPAFLPIAPVSTMHPVVVAAAAAGLHPAGLHPVHSTTSHHSLGSQPPPLLRVSPVSRMENPHHHQHPRSRSCACSACATYFACEREGGAGQLLQPSDVSLPRLSPHSPHGSLKAGVTGSHAQSTRYLQAGAADPRPAGHDVGNSQKTPGVFPPSSVPSAVYQVSPRASQGLTEGYPVSHPAYSVPSLYTEGKRVPEGMQADPHLAKPERGDYHRTEPAAYGKGVSGFPVPVGVEQPGMISCPPDHLTVKHFPPPHLPGVPGKPRLEEGPVLDLTIRHDDLHSASYTDDEKPLDLSKKPSPSSFVHDKQVQHHTNDMQRQSNTAVYVDAHGRSVAAAIPMVDRRRDTDKLMSGSQHLHKLETSVETYFQKLQHPHAGQVPPRAGPAVPGSGSGMPSSSAAISLPSHHPIHRSQHAYQSPPVPQQPAGYMPTSHASNGNSPYNSDLLSPTGGRRPQLHPIPAPNLAITLGPSVTPQGASPYQSRAGSSHPSVPASTTPHAPALNSPHSQPLPPVSTPTLETSSCPSSGSVVINSFAGENVHPQGSRSVSPPGSERRMSGEDRRRGSVSKHEPITNILGNNNPADILYLICRLCRQTYGSPYGFRKHFRNQHGFEPKAEHTIVQTISATKNARQLSSSQGVDVDGQSEESFQGFHQNLSSSDGVGPVQSSGFPQNDVAAVDSPASHSSKSPTDFAQQDVDKGQYVPPKYRRHSRSSTDSKGRPASVNGSSALAVGGSLCEEREDTKCLECPECGQAFQLNDFGSYKRHCRQHGQMRGVAAGAGNGGPGLYTCTDCQCSFSELHLLQEHLVRHESHTAPAVCHVCHHSFPAVIQLQEHLRTAHAESASGQLSSSPLSSSSLSATPTLTASRKSNESAPVPVKSKTEMSVHSSGCISSSTNGQSSYGTSKMGPDSSVSSFNLTVTTPSDLKVQRLPADHIVTSASPDSSSDNKAAESSPLSSSAQPKVDNGKGGDSFGGVDCPKVKVEQDKVPSKTQPTSSEDDKDSGYSGERCPSNDSRSVSTDGSLASPMETEESPDLYLYKHKKFGAHRKRTGSSDVSDPDAKHARQDSSTVSGVDSSSQKTDGHLDQSSATVDTSSTEKQSKNGVGGKSAKHGLAVSVDGNGGSGIKTVPAKTEARHHMPFVWDRVTRSQAGRNARITDSS